MNDFDTKLAAFIEYAQGVMSRHFAENYKNLTAPTLSVDPRGVKYVRIVREGSVHCFVNRETGDILKAESWKRPHPTPRGNINDTSTFARCCTPFGVAYLR